MQFLASVFAISKNAMTILTSYLLKMIIHVNYVILRSLDHLRKVAFFRINYVRA